MKTNVLIFIYTIFTFHATFCQVQNNYPSLTSEAVRLYENKKYWESGKKYHEAFMLLGDKGLASDRFHAACSWALANEVDSSFIQLFRQKKVNYADYNELTQNPDFTNLHTDPRWQELLELVKSNKEKAERNLDNKLVAKLDTNSTNLPFPVSLKSRNQSAYVFVLLLASMVFVKYTV